MQKCIIILILLCTFLSGCNLIRSEQYKFQQDLEQIQNIEIAKYESDQSVLGPMETLKVLDPSEHRIIIESIPKIEGSVNHLSPGYLFSDRLIKITYKNGAVEIIGVWASVYIDPSGNVHYIDYLFNEEQYGALLSSILGETVTHPELE